MALNAAVALEVRTTGVDTNGGGFRTGAAGTDWSQQNAAQYAVTDGVTAGTTTITSLTANFGVDVVGNLVYVQGGTGSVVASWYEIISRTNSTTIVVDRLTGLTAGTGVTINIGGALLSPGIAASIATVAGIITYIQNGTYSITSASTNVAAGCIAATANTFFIGYSASRTFGNTGTRPILRLNVTTASIVTSGAANYNRIAFDGNSQTTSRYSAAATANFYDCTMANCTAANTGNCVLCSGTGCSATVFGSFAHSCVATGNTASPFIGSSFNCISYANTGGGTSGFAPGSTSYTVNCVAYNNGNNGFTSTGSVVLFVNCIAEANAGRGFNGNGTNVTLINCAYYNNTIANLNGILANANGVLLTGSPFTNAAGNDFSLNTTASAGASCRAAGIPGVTTAGTGYIDIGALQHQDPASSDTYVINRVTNQFNDQLI